MANNDIWLGANFDIDTSGLDAGLKKANKLIRESESEFKAAAAGLEDWQSSSKGLQARINHLNNTTDIQRKKIDALNKEYDRLSKEGLDPTSDKMIKLKTDINNEKAALAKNETELKQQSKALEDLGKEADDTSKDVKELDEEVDKISFGLKALKGVSKVAVTSIAAIGAAAVGAVAGFLSLAESTREYREDINKLQTGFQTAGFTAEQATDVYKEFYAVLGEEDRSVEAVNHLAKLCDTQEDLNKWTDIATGVWATFGDSLPIEGLTEASNEVAKTGELTGVLVDALNWAGVSEDEFKKKLEACNSESERASLITETLNDLYADSADKYRELNKDIMDAQRAQSELTDAMAELGAIAEPIMTDLKLLVSDFVRELTPFVEVIGKGLAGAFKGSEDAAENLSNGISGLVNMLINNFVSMLPVVLSTILQIVP